jgi:hypothetical protein
MVDPPANWMTRDLNIFIAQDLDQSMVSAVGEFDAG